MFSHALRFTLLVPGSSIASARAPQCQNVTPRPARPFGAHAAVILAWILSAMNVSTPALADDKFVPFQDPLEHAFRLEIPSGWSTRGGMFRLGYSDYRPMVDVKSADGKIGIRLGDVAIPRAYALPTAFHPRDGEVDDLGAQAHWIYARYRTGKEYARLYALARFGPLCRKLIPQASGWTPRTVARDTAASSAGSITYRCDAKQEGARIAYVYAATGSAAGNTLWQVTSLVSFIASPDRVPSVHAVIDHGTKTFTLSPSWIADQNKKDAQGLAYQRARQQGRLEDLQRQVAQFETRMHAMQSQVDAFERNQAAQSTEFEGFDNAINGITPTVDPLSAQTRDVFTGPNSGYWENGWGTVVNSNGSPGSGFHRLKPY